MTKNKKLNSYLKIGIIMLLSVLAGGVIGVGAVFFDFASFGGAISAFLGMIRTNLLMIQICLGLLMTVIGELTIRKMRVLGILMVNASDEDSDRLDYELERYGSIGVVSKTVLYALSILALATGYSMDFIAQASKSENILLLITFVVFILICFYEGYWQVRFVKLTQKIDPAKKGDPTSTKFQEQWIASCDEAERQMIYQASHKTYIKMQKIIPVLILITMLSHLMWDTGIMAVAIVGIVWVLQTWFYCRTCVATKKKI